MFLLLLLPILLEASFLIKIETFGKTLCESTLLNQNDAKKKKFSLEETEDTVHTCLHCWMLVRH